MRHIQWLIAFCLVLSILPGCRKFVEAGNPRTQLATGNVFSSNSSATGALTSIYSQIRSMRDFDFITGLTGDELTYYLGNTYAVIYKNALTSRSTGSLGSLFWDAMYKYIYQANAVIDGLQHYSGVDQAVKTQLTGEAKFIRAFCHLYLYSLYGDAAIVTGIDYAVNRTLPRAPRADVLRQVISDLTEARQMLNDQYVDAKNTPTTERVRPTRWVATALLARAYLFAGDYPNAEKESTAMINNSSFRLLDDLSGVFLKGSQEAIWQLPGGVVGDGPYTSDEAGMFLLFSSPGIMGGMALSPQILGAFENGDRRKDNWVGSITTADGTYYYAYKYKMWQAPVATEYSVVLRLAEQYLIRAEALARQERLTESAADLDAIRHRAGLPGTTAATRDELLAAILHERQVELFMEGHRWIDLIRTGKVDEVMKVVTPLKGGGQWESFRRYYPISEADIQNSSQALQQTQGY